MEDLYKILNITPETSAEDMKKAFRKLSLKYHPDRNPNSQERYKKISGAYEVLSDPERRKKYDFEKNNPFSSLDSDVVNMFFGRGQNMTGQRINLNGLFGNSRGVGPTIFSQATPIFRNIHQQLSKPAPVIKNIEITLKQSYQGLSYPIQISRWVLVNNVKQNENETIYIKIPPGIDNNEIIIAREKGNIINESLKGDVKVFVKINNNTRFIREGLNLYYQYDISLKDALCGFNFKIHHINGKIFNLNNSSGNIILPNQEKIIPKLGMIRSNNIGDLIIRFNVEFPKTLDEITISKLKEIL